MASVATTTQLRDLNEHSNGTDNSSYVLRAAAASEGTELEHADPPVDAFEALPNGGTEAWTVISACMFLVSDH